MRKTKSEQWIEALEWDNKTLNVPTIVSREIAKQAAKALKKAKPYKPAIRMDGRPKVKTIKQLKNELDKVFSVFIRTRDSDHNGIGTCATCGVSKQWREMDAGHYVPRQDLATRWDEKNVYLQCKPCNGFRGGEPEKMAKYIDWVHGYGTAESLRSKKLRFLISRSWLEAKIKEYKTITRQN